MPSSKLISLFVLISIVGILFIPINVTEFYKTTEQYVVKEPYTTTETYYEKEPYIITETYYEKEPIKKSVPLSYKVLQKTYYNYFWSSGCNVYVTVQNVDSEGGLFNVKVDATTTTGSYSKTSSEVFIASGESYKFELSFTGDYKSSTYSVNPPFKEVIDYQDVAKQREVTKFQDVAKQREVIGTRDVTKERSVVESRTVQKPIYKIIQSYLPSTSLLPILSIFLALCLIVLYRYKKSGQKTTSLNEFKSTPSINKQTLEAPIKKSKDKGTIDIKSAFQYKGATIQYKVKIINQTPDPISDIKIQLFVPDVFMLKEKEKSIPMLEPNESKTATFDIRPTGECGDCIVSGRINYYDYDTKKRQDVDIEKKMISIVCPVLKRKEIDEDGWRNATEELIKAEENTKDLDIPAENLFNIATRVLKDMSMYMIPPEITSTPQLFTGVGMFYAEGAAGLRYAAYVEVVGGHKSRMILKAWAEKEEALTGFYHRILDEIEKRLDIKIFIDEGIIQYHVHKTEIKDNIIQRSNIGTGARKCPNCGKEMEANEKFCHECGEKL